MSNKLKSSGKQAEQMRQRRQLAAGSEGKEASLKTAVKEKSCHSATVTLTTAQPCVCVFAEVRFITPEIAQNLSCAIIYCYWKSLDFNEIFFFVVVFFLLEEVFQT